MIIDPQGDIAVTFDSILKVLGHIVVMQGVTDDGEILIFWMDTRLDGDELDVLASVTEDGTMLCSVPSGHVITLIDDGGAK